MLNLQVRNRYRKGSVPVTVIRADRSMYSISFKTIIYIIPKWRQFKNNLSSVHSFSNFVIFFRYQRQDPFIILYLIHENRAIFSSPKNLNRYLFEIASSGGFYFTNQNFADLQTLI